MTTLTQKCQITIPKEIRIAASLKQGDEVDFEITSGRVLLKKKFKEIPFGKWKGYLGNFKTDKLMKEIR